MFAHRGNGIGVCDRSREENGDYKQIAHISTDREIKWYSQRVSPAHRAEIEGYAMTADPNISATQEAKVFNKRP